MSKYTALFRVVLVPAVLVLLAGCAVKPLSPDVEVEDVRVLSQNPESYVVPGEGDRLLISPEQRGQDAVRYLDKFFAPWRAERAMFRAEDAFWGVKRWGGHAAWGENTLKRDPSWWDGLNRLADKSSYPNTNMRAIMVRNSGMRVMPTSHPHFNNFSKAGEGYPFDNFQNSGIWAGMPVHVSQMSSDMAWGFVETAYAAGWVRTSDLAWVDDDFVKQFMTGTYAAIIRDYVPLSGERGNVRFMGRVGALYPVVGSDAETMTLLIPAADENRRAVLKRSIVPAEDCGLFPMAATPSAIASIASELIGQEYGWAGLYGNRDCSSMTRDLLAPFGIWLPRNSRGQLRAGKTISLKSMTPKEKEATILEQGVPWLTVVGKGGHVMLYIGKAASWGDDRTNGKKDGQKDVRPVVMHAVWGLRTYDSDGKEGRKVIGKAVITTLEPGRELEPWIKPETTLLNRITTMSILGQ